MGFKSTEAQQNAIDAIDTNVSVSAGAGSGKTKVLVERFINIVESKKASADQILAITFTRKAAKEMKERLTQSFSEKYNLCPIAMKKFWNEQIGLLEHANIKTIDGFCSGVIRENPIETKVNPNFSVAEEYEVKNFYQEKTKKYIVELLSVNDLSINKLIENYGIDKFQEQVFLLSKSLDDIVEENIWGEPYKSSIAKNKDIKVELIALIQEVVDCLDELKGKHRVEVEKLADNIEKIIKAIGECNFQILEKYLGSSNLSARNKIDKEKVKEINDVKLVELKQLYADEKALEVIEYWKDFLTGLYNYIETKRDEVGLIGFANIEKKALDTLQNNSEVLQKYNEKFKFIMVDEFQDTNNKQRRLVYLLAGGDAEKLFGNKLFIVGDPKQSVYRFRGADVKVFLRVIKDIENSGGVNIVLDDNFRSTSNVLDCCNEVFKELFDTNQGSTIEFQKLNSHRTSEVKNELNIIHAQKEEKEESVMAEANLVVRKIKEVLKDNSKLTYKDIAILVAVISKAKSFADALQKAGIPYNMSDSKGFFEKQEIMDVVNLLKFLENKNRDIELAGVLRSPYFGISDNTLTTLFLNKNKNSIWDVLDNDVIVKSIKKDQRDVLLLAKSKLECLVNAAKTLGLPDLLDEITEILSLNVILAAQEFGREKIANYVELKKIIIAFANQKNGTINEIGEYLDLLKAEGIRVTPELDSSLEDSVSIMTIHKSKGLEFPIVFLPVLTTAGKNSSFPIKYDSGSGIGIKIKSKSGEMLETNVLKEFINNNKFMEAEEKKRQLYVAMTRAEEYLIMSGINREKSRVAKDNWFETLHNLLNVNASGLGSVNTTKYEAKDLLDEIIEEKELKDSVVNKKVYNQICNTKNENLLEKVLLSASAITDYLHCPRQFFYRYIEEIPEVEENEILDGNGTSSKEIGQVVHKVLEDANLDNYEKELKNAIDSFIEDKEKNKIKIIAENLLNKYHKSDMYNNISKYAYKAEHYFKLALFEINGQEVYFSGLIDRLIIFGEDELGVVDYKTGSLGSDVNEGYLLQIALYEWAVEKLYEKKVSLCELHFLGNNKKMNIGGDSVLHRAKIKDICLEIVNKKEEQDFNPCPSNCSLCNFRYMCPDSK